MGVKRRMEKNEKMEEGTKEIERGFGFEVMFSEKDGNDEAL